MIHEHFVAWLQAHKTDNNADFVYKAWLDAGRDRELIRIPLRAWIKKHATDIDAQFIYKAWLDARGKKSYVRRHILSWLQLHNESIKASFIHVSWLQAGGDLKLVRPFILVWLQIHGSTREALFVYRVWLKAKGELDILYKPLAAWLQEYETEIKADSIYYLWLDAKGPYGFIERSAIKWLIQHGNTLRAGILIKHISRQRYLPTVLIAYILNWCRAFSTHPDTIWRLAQLKTYLLNPKIAQDVIMTSQIVLEPFITSKDPLKITTRGLIISIFSFLIAAPGLSSGPLRDQVDALLLAWLHHPSSYKMDLPPHLSVQRKPYVQRIIDLIESRDLDIVRDREPIERFLHWVNAWSPKHKRRIKAIFDHLNHSYSAPGLWDIVTFR